MLLNSLNNNSTQIINGRNVRFTAKKQHKTDAPQVKEMEKDTVELSKEQKSTKSPVKSFSDSIKGVWDSGMFGKIVLLNCFSGSGFGGFLPIMLIADTMHNSIRPEQPIGLNKIA